MMNEIDYDYVISRSRDTNQIDLQRFETRTEAQMYLNDKQNEGWDSIRLKVSDLELFNFFN